MTSILIIGVGSLGSELVNQLLNEDKYDTIRLFDNAEQALSRVLIKHPEEPKLHCILGDITNYEKIKFACTDIDDVILTAAKKFIDFGSYNPDIFIETNVLGTENVIKACIRNNVKRALFISSDKALHEVGIYAHTKAIGEDLWKWGNQISKITKFSTIRPPNFSPSEGSIFSIWDEALVRGKKILLTDKQMKRYFIKLEDIAAFVLTVLETMQGGEIFVPKCEEKEIYKLALEYAQGNESQIKIIGLRPGERLSERLLSEEEEAIAVDMGSYLIIYPR